ncbi:ribonuclease J [Roseivivax sp. CAU 1753]
MSGKRLIYLALGGAGEIGMNCYVYGYGEPDQERLIVVDLGVTFPDMDTSPGVDLIFPDVSWLKARRDRIEAIFITHAHEDHVGAISHFWEDLGAPVYARAFTANIARRKFDERGLNPEIVKTQAPWPVQQAAGPFNVGFAPISHSIPESSSMVIDTPLGRVVHSGDFKIDVTPVVGEPFDRAMWEKISADGVIALVCDSTNVFSEHEGRSEATVGPEIEKLLLDAKSMVVATTFASNVARLKTLAEAGERAGRSIVLMGRAMRRMVEAGVETGVLTGFPTTVPIENAGDVPRDSLMLIVTGSQGERRAASAQLARGKHFGIELKDGDLFLFSSKTIPGNEKGVIRIMNQLSEKGVDVVDDSSGRYHVSGHANRPDLVAMHRITNADLVIPMHGEHRHLRTHVKLAESMGRKGALAPNGTMIDLSTGKPCDFVETGRVYLDGSVKVGAMDGVVRDRIRMALNGHVTVTLVLDEDDKPLGEPWCDIMGLSETGRSRQSLDAALEEELGQFVERAKAKVLSDDKALEDGLRRTVRSAAQNEIGKKPEVTVVISRLS